MPYVMCGSSSCQELVLGRMYGSAFRRTFLLQVAWILSCGRDTAGPSPGNQCDGRGVTTSLRELY